MWPVALSEAVTLLLREFLLHMEADFFLCSQDLATILSRIKREHIRPLCFFKIALTSDFIRFGSPK